MRSGPAEAAEGSSRPPIRSATPAGGAAPPCAPAGASAPSSVSSAVARCRTEACGELAAFLTGLGSVCRQCQLSASEICPLNYE